MPVLVSFCNQWKIIGSRSSIQRCLLVFAVGIKCGREIVGFRNQYFLQIIRSLLSTGKVSLVFEILVSHYQRQSSRRSTTPTSVNYRKIITKLAGETTVSLLQPQKYIQHIFHLLLPFGMTTPVLFFISKKVQHSIDSFGLTAYTVHRIFIAFIKIDRLFEETDRSKAVLQVAIKHFHTICFQILPIRLVTIFPSIECIKKHTTNKSYFRLPITLAIFRH